VLSVPTATDLFDALAFGAKDIVTDVASRDVFGSGTGEDGMEWFHS
jgi:hypothetical protein